MSKHSRSGSSQARAISAAAAAPPAGPESTVRTAWSAAVAASTSPPLDCITWGAGRPAAPVRARSPRRYAPSSGVSAASSSVVAARSYSRNVPTTSCERATGTSSPSSARSASPRSSSCAASRQACSRQTATASGPQAATSRASAAAAAGSSARSVPVGPIRSGAANRRSAGVIGAGRAAHRR